MSQLMASSSSERSGPRSRKNWRSVSAERPLAHQTTAPRSWSTTQVR
jgi:hypothetical protein